jgi:sugar phosphate isomerase/epimerase
LAPSADIICIRDMIVDEGGVTRHVLPGKGALDMTGMVGALKKNASPDALWLLRPPPLVNTEELTEAREYVQDLLAREDAGAASV